jgi:hypothetical protein
VALASNIMFIRQVVEISRMVLEEEHRQLNDFMITPFLWMESRLKTQYICLFLILCYSVVSVCGLIMPMKANLPTVSVSYL